jgi:hypothetical protein
MALNELMCDMKTILVALFFTMASASAFGQDSLNQVTYPVWSISKPVQKLQYRNSVFKGARIYTGNAWVLTKDVHQLQLVRNGRLETHRVKTGTSSSSFISKGVARMQYDRNRKR